MKIIGITGGIGSGKSKVLRYIEETYQAVVCDTDSVAHRLQEPGEKCYEEIVRCFGRNILKDNTEIDRKVLGSIVFGDTEKLEQLNRIVHPAVKEEVKKQLQTAEKEGKTLFLIESALLMQDHYEEICDELWYIYADETVRRKRLLSSGDLSEEKINAVIKTQADENAFRNYCQVVIDNSGVFENTQKQIEKAVSRR